MRDARPDTVIPATHLRVMLPSSMDANLPPVPPPMVMNNHSELPPPMPDYSAPPPYDMALNLDAPISSKLPTYEEVQREKQIESDGPPLPPRTHTYTAFVSVNGNAVVLPDDNIATNDLLGTDYMFLTAFFIAFLFNWIGFLVLMCFSHTVASRYGALSGFGLSLAKWTLIVKHSTQMGSHENTWLWWLIMVFGVLICVRAVIQYLNIKRGWRLLSGTAQERLLFFY